MSATKQALVLGDIDTYLDRRTAQYTTSNHPSWDLAASIPVLINIRIEFYVIIPNPRTLWAVVYLDQDPQTT